MLDLGLVFVVHMSTLDGFHQFLYRPVIIGGPLEPSPRISGLRRDAMVRQGQRLVAQVLREGPQLQDLLCTRGIPWPPGGISQKYVDGPDMRAHMYIWRANHYVGREEISD